MSRPSKAHPEGAVDKDLFVAYEEIRRNAVLQSDELDECQSLRDWVILFLRANGRLLACVGWSMSDDNQLGRKMRGDFPDAVMSLVTVLILWRLWWQRQ